MYVGISKKRVQKNQGASMCACLIEDRMTYSFNHAGVYYQHDVDHTDDLTILM